MSKPIALAIDLILIIAFAVLGRRNHDEPPDAAGLAMTAWPFLVGALVGWALIAFMLRRLPLLSQGVVVAADTIVLGMLLRLAAGQGMSWPFPLIAALMLTALLLGWRCVVVADRWWGARASRD